MQLRTNPALEAIDKGMITLDLRRDEYVVAPAQRVHAITFTALRLRGKQLVRETWMKSSRSGRMKTLHMWIKWER